MPLKIKKNEECIEIFNLFEEGGYNIKCFDNGRIALYEIPRYGGKEGFVGYYSTINAAIEEGESWT